MASVSRRVTSTINSNLTAYATLTVTEQSVDNANNSSVVKWTLTINQEQSIVYFSGSTRTQGGIVQATINGTVVVNSYYPLSQSSSLTTKTVYSNSGTLTVPHDSDGTKTISFNLNMNKGNDNYSSAGYYWNGDGDNGVNGSLTLTKIIRGFYIKANEIWKNITIYIKKNNVCTRISKVYIKKNGTWT